MIQEEFGAPPRRTERRGGDKAPLRTKNATRRHFGQRVAFATIALLGVAVMLYPSVASWFFALRATNTIESYVEHTDKLDPAVREAELAAADRYNASEVRGLIIDPFSNTEGANQLPLDADAQHYLEVLAADPDGVMARVSIPAINIDLPVYHGTTEETLRKGVGHLYGSSLPVGGTSSHAILTGHSGLPEAALFTNLDELSPGDEIYIDVLDRSLTYRVTGSEVVEPTDISALSVVPGQDLLTLITCTPTGVNTHRLLVHAERVTDTDTSAPRADAHAVSFPWWMVIAGAALIAWLIMVLPRRGDRKNNARPRHVRR